MKFQDFIIYIKKVLFNILIYIGIRSSRCRSWIWLGVHTDLAGSSYGFGWEYIRIWLGLIRDIFRAVRRHRLKCIRPFGSTDTSSCAKQSKGRQPQRVSAKADYRRLTRECFACSVRGPCGPCTTRESATTAPLPVGRVPCEAHAAHARRAFMLTGFVCGNCFGIGV